MSKKEDAEIQRLREEANEAGRQRYDGTAETAIQILKDVTEANTALHRKLAKPSTDSSS
jgi:hypothetical protein